MGNTAQERLQERLEAQRAYQEAYRASPEARAARRKYAASPEFKAAKRKYSASPKGRAVKAARYVRGKSAALVYLGGVCVACGTTERLEFDHIDPSDKSYTIAGRLKYAWAALVKELDKCQLLCKPCHQKKTNGDREAA